MKLHQAYDGLVQANALKKRGGGGVLTHQSYTWAVGVPL